MNIKPSMSKRAIRITTALALVAVTSVIAVSLLMIGGGATAFNADASDSVARHIPIPAQYTAQCFVGGAVPALFFGLAADCDALLASKDTLEGTTGNLNWSANRAISDWSGVTVANNRVSKLELSGRRLNGRIPSELGNLASLTYLDLSSNRLTGAIPSELGNLANLTYLDLVSNQLTGEIPSELGNLAKLTGLDLHNNRLTGEIPSELGKLAKLTGLDLYNNRLTGEIPSELGNLANLTYLDLSSNRLTGEIPSELGNLANLEYLYLFGNQLTGCIPRSLRAGLDSSEIQNIGLPFCAATTTATPTATSTPRATATPTPTATSAPLTTATPTPTATSAPGGRTTPVATSTPTATSVPGGRATPVATPTPTATSVASNVVMNRLTALETQVAEIPELKRQIAAMATSIARLEGASPIAPPTPTHTPTATPIIITGATPSPTPTSVAGATPSPTATRVAGTSGGNACVTRLAGSASVSGSWSDACLSANSPPNDETYYSRFYTFTLDAAARVTITLSSATAAPYLYLLDGAGTDGTVRLSNGDVATSVAITANLPPGAYTIEASTWYSETYGDFTLELEIR